MKSTKKPDWKLRDKVIGNGKSQIKIHFSKNHIF